MNRSHGIGAAVSLCVAFASVNAHAVVDDSCSGGSECVLVNQTGATGNAIVITGFSGNGRGVDSETNSGEALYGNSSSGVGARGVSSSANGVQGESVTGNGVYGTSSSGGAGVLGIASFNDGVRGQSTGIGNAGVSGLFTPTTGLGYGVYAGSASSDGYGLFGAGGKYAVYANGNLAYTGTFTHVSDERLKTQIESLNGADSLAQLLRLRGVSFRWKDPAKHGNTTAQQRGFIAQEYEKVFPEAVKTDADGIKSIDTTGLDALEVEALRDLKRENDELRTRIAALEAGRRPVLAGFGGDALGGFALVTLGAGFFVARRRRHDPAI